MIVHYAEVGMSNIFTETHYEKITERNPDMVKRPEYAGTNKAFCFRLVDREEVITGDGKVLTGEWENRSGIYYFPPARMMSLEEVRSEMPSESILIRNMENNDWSHIVKTNAGQCMPFNPATDIILDK